ncbi:sigma-54 dependent transcriptional regulator [Aidingimonas halophila]|uniref:DNA-binding transcriptional response regulator, NtrC family, contains REC, AAA-type ATPase, and a Fis-type DNA-binding domains n=1 Tax=Aidingimonas halophila TaxID=574349 RepID=A0A1H2XN41_9GAMM|nr:sigma-54 dependent transcriptional regulator [Aidingimonas halophila]GHC29026.1 sigma-54-dependent Fis family transcriptional regulator [Aidingimonas halophila]SDW94332.1 DNA-binding transcriptional response regulator, NtrC family, contains REC, AAA-type ATPase, and a Fis-type DNA-binding domains [Aidingimonas halophila]
MEVTKRLLFVGADHHHTPPVIADMAQRGWSIQCAPDTFHADELIHSHPCDVGLMYVDVDKHHQKAAEKLVMSHPMEWVALVDNAALDDHVSCRILSQLFYAYHTLPIDVAEIDCLLTHALAMARLAPLPGRDCQLGSSEYEMVGTTPEMHKLFNMIRRVAAVDAPVFISGESGTGKELAAHAVHERSTRAEGPFVAVNCGALPASLIQSELFGHEKGAFTGATQRKIGRIEAASGGTLFLDEIGDLPLDMQVNLLRFLQDHQIQRVGGLKEINVDVRVLAATHIDLEAAVREGRFREDLYHRLNVLQINVPPLRERQEDIEVLARFFFDKFANEKPAQLRGFSQETLALMRQYDWPGNIRELINRVRRAMVMCERRLIRPADMGLERRHNSREVLTLEQARDAAERDALVAALARNKYKIQNAAKELGVSRVTLYRLIDKHDIVRPESAELHH